MGDNGKHIHVVFSGPLDIFPTHTLPINSECSLMVIRQQCFMATYTLIYRYMSPCWQLYLTIASYTVKDYDY